MLPDGYELARDFAELDPGAKVKGKLKVVGSEAEGAGQMPAPVRRLQRRHDRGPGRRGSKGSAGSKRAGKRFKVAKGEFEAKGGKRTTVKMRLTRRARAYSRRTAS